MVPNIHLLGLVCYLVHGGGETIEVVDGVVGARNDVDGGIGGVEMGRDKKNGFGCLGKNLVLP